MKKAILLVLVCISILIFGINKILNVKKGPLNSSNPIAITIWHYYNGNVKDKFDDLVNKFNESIGVERGIVIDAKSHGDVQQLADAVYNAANKTIGSEIMPDIFAAYPDNAYRINKVIELVDLEQYFSGDELKAFRKEFLEEGRFGTDQRLRIVPIAKSTEVLYLNKTYWDSFAKEANVGIEELSTWEGLVRAAEKYKKYSGKALFSIDANANYMLLASMQLGKELYNYNGNRVRLNFSEDVAYRIWNNYYIPYLKGYFTKSGRFSSDDAKTGIILSYTGSTAGSAYFPKQVTFSQSEVYPIDVITLPYPYFENGEKYVIQQGAGMCITKSDKAHEYASALFLKWFTAAEQNVDFAVSTAYFPVKNEALEKNKILTSLNKTEITNKAIGEAINTTLKMLESYTMYGNKPFEGSYDMRVLLETHLFNFMQKDLNFLEKRVAEGEERSKVIEALSSKERFDKWYQQFKQEAEQIISK